jgi:hypothetical protein
MSSIRKTNLISARTSYWRGVAAAAGDAVVVAAAAPHAVAAAPDAVAAAPDAVAPLDAVAAAPDAVASLDAAAAAGVPAVAAGSLSGPASAAAEAAPGPAGSGSAGGSGSVNSSTSSRDAPLGSHSGLRRADSMRLTYWLACQQADTAGFVCKRAARSRQIRLRASPRRTSPANGCESDARVVYNSAPSGHPRMTLTPGSWRTSAC